MWPALVVPYAAAAVLLAVAGVPKVRDPGDLVRAVRSVGMPFGRNAVRAFAAAEVVVAVAALGGAEPAHRGAAGADVRRVHRLRRHRPAARRRAVELRLLRQGRHPAHAGARAGDRRGIRHRAARRGRPAGRRRLVGARPTRAPSRWPGSSRWSPWSGSSPGRSWPCCPPCSRPPSAAAPGEGPDTVLAVVIAEGVAIALLAVLVLGLLRSHALILRALHELGAGPRAREGRRGRGPAARRHPGPVAVQIEPGVVPATRAGVEPGPRRRRRGPARPARPGRARRCRRPAPDRPCWPSSPRAAASA